MQNVSEDNGKKLFEGNEISLIDASTLLETFCSRFHLSDEASMSLYSLMKALLPSSNCFPSGRSHIQRIKQNFTEQLRVLEKETDHSFCVLNFCQQLRNIVSRYLDVIHWYSLSRLQNPSSDLNSDFSPRVKVDNFHSIQISLSLFADGVNIKKSTYKKELWPIWLQVYDLPPKLRMARKNIILAALFVGSGHPDWEKLVPALRAELLSPVELEKDSSVTLTVHFVIKLLVSDLCAKSHVLNMFQFNGFFGCHYCTAEGHTIGKTHAYYPFNQTGQIREPQVNDLFVAVAESYGPKKRCNIVGVKGKSAFLTIINGLSLTAPIDYMHCVLLGIF